MSPGTALSPRATVTAAGFVLDVPVIGRAEAVHRVLAHWRDGTELRELPDGRWLLVLAEPVAVRGDRAPGLPLRAAADGTLAAFGAAEGPSGPGRLVLVEAGRTITRPLAGLTATDPSGWLSPAGLTLHRPRPVGAAAGPEAAPVVDAVPTRPRPDLRAAAGILPPSVRAGRLAAETGGSEAPSGQGSWKGPVRAVRATPAGRLAYLATALVLLGVGWLVLFSDRAHLVVDQGPRIVGLFALWFVLTVAYHLIRGDRGGHRGGAEGGNAATGATAGAATGAATGPARGSARRSARTRRPVLRHLLARLTLRTPAARSLHRRHLRYLRELTRAFEQRRWDDALRDALPLAARASDDTGRPWLSLGLPRRFTGALRATPRSDALAVASPFHGPTSHQHLTALYRHAAERLEKAGRIDEAAFVLADLLDAPAEAVALLDRHDRSAQAAELAEGRDLAAELVVRLWWRAGERDRAVRTAHRRSAFAAAVVRLAATDPSAGRELRAAWAEHRRAAGDRLGAVEAAWPDEALRPSVVADLRDAVALGGPDRGRALPHLLALGVGQSTRAFARAVLDGDGDPRSSGRTALAATLAELPAADPAADRELATAAALAAVRDGGIGGPDAGPGARAADALLDRLLLRADPLVAEDLARPRPAPRPAGVTPAYTAADRPGTLPVLDAALLASGLLLVACGQAGVRLIGPDGRTRASWDTPADRLVLADHGAVALLVADYGDLREVSRLDLVTRAVRPWTTLRARQFASSFDGRHLITEDADGIAVLDTLAPRPSVVWRELVVGQRLVGRINRTPGGCAAVVRSSLPDGSPFTEVWRWDLPGWELRARLRVDDALAEPHLEPAALAAGGLLAASAPTGEAPGTTTLCWTSGLPTVRLRLDGAASDAPATDGDHWAVTVPLPDGAGLRLHAGTGPARGPALTAVFPDADPSRIGVRRHAGAVTYRHRSGRVLATSADGATLLANVRVTV
ncbi:bpX6 domain-containing protein [Kitasatospora sp. NPDC058201]|uniref:bpX6 domain-containing protein n=1 Tax=unclassified Kitasatospora TaxID=2633591 RepID=UPI0036558B91